MKTILYNPIFINPQAYYVFPRLTRYLQPDNESTAEPANYIGTIEVKVIAYGDTTLKRTYTDTNSIDLSEFKNTWIRISLFTKVGSCVLGEWKIGNMESDLPYIDPEVLASLKAVVIVGNKTNNDSDRAIVKNLVDASNPFVISNASYNLNSGYGKYIFDFTRWGLTKPPTTCIKKNDSFNITYVGRPVSEGECIVETGNNSDSDIQVYFKVEISGIEDDMEGWFNTANFRNRQQLYNGINIINVTVNSKHWYGFDFIRTDGTALGNCNIVVKQIPEFQGAFVTDGVNDTIISTKTAAEMGITDEVTVVSMIHQITLNTKYNIATTNYIENSDTKEHVRTDAYVAGKTGIYGYTASLINSTRSTIGYILGDIRDYQAVGTTNKQTILDSKFSVEGRVGGFGEVSSVAWYWTVIANKVLTADQINQVIAYYDLDRTLSPDIYCDVAKQGITNSNHTDFDDKLIDYSGNGRDIQLNNLAWDGDSGIGKYNYPNWKVNVTQGNKYARIVYYDSINGTYSANFKGITDLYKSYGLSIEIRVNRANTVDFHSIKEDGIYTITPPDDTTSIDIRFGGENVYNASCDITITQIPSHAGALCLDGINDFGKVTGMPIYKDYTFIIDRQIITNDDSGGIVASKSESATDVTKQGAFIFEYLSSNSISTWSYYKNNSLVASSNSNRNISYQSKYSYNGKVLEIGEAKDSDKLWIGTIRDNDERFANIAIYSLMSFPYSMSKFLIERQLKKHKLGTLYPNMVEFRPVIKQDDRIKSIKYYIDNKTANIGQYYPIGTGLGIAVETVQPYMVKSLKVNGVNTIPNADYKGFNARLDSKSPQKITMDIQVDSSLVQWNPVVESNAEYQVVDFYINTYPAVVGNYYPINSKLRIAITTKGAADEVTSLTVNGVSLGTPSINGNRFTFNGTLPDKSPQNINIAIDEYIRFEDIVQPYPVLLRFNDENGNEVSWGGKFRVGSTITRIGSAADSNLLPNIYNIFGLLLNDNQVTSSKVIVEKTMVFKAKSAYIFDNNEPNCILSPRLLSIPNSSYKILGYIPDISGHGNHGVIHNSAYAEESGVNEDGSYQFDGVDDFVTIPTVTGGKQVLMKVNWQKEDTMIYNQNPGEDNFAIFANDYNNNNNVVNAYASRNNGSTYIDGILNNNILATQLKNVTHNITITNENVINNTIIPVIGVNAAHNNFYSQMALYDFMLFDNISTDDKIKELNEYIGIEPKVELPPYYWDAYGKTNLDADKTTIQQRGTAEGDYDITNYNHAYDKMSGYGGYNLGRFDKSWASSSSSNTSIKVVQRNPYDITLKKLGGNSDWEFNNTELKVISNPVSVKFKSNKNIRVTCDYHYYPVGGNSEGTPLGITSKDLIANKDAIITISPISQENIDKYNIDVNRGYYLIYFQLSSTLAVNEEVTIEMLPLYPNGLVYDGVTDYSENANIPALTDYTYIFKRTLLNKKYNSASVFKGSNQQSGGGAFICDYNSVEPELMIQGYSFGAGLYANSLNTNDIVYGTKNSVNGAIIAPGNNADVEGLAVGKWRAYRQMVFYKLILYPKTISLLQINFLKNLMERDEIIDLTNPIFIQE